MGIEVRFALVWSDGTLAIPENRGLELSPSLRHKGATTTEEAEAWCIENDVQINKICLVGKTLTDDAHAFMSFETKEGATKYMMVFC